MLVVGSVVAVVADPPVGGVVVGVVTSASEARRWRSQSGFWDEPVTAATAVAAPAAASRPAATDSIPILRFRRRRDRRGSTSIGPDGTGRPGRTQGRDHPFAGAHDISAAPATTSGCSKVDRTVSGKRTARPW